MGPELSLLIIVVGITVTCTHPHEPKVEIPVHQVNNTTEIQRNFRNLFDSLRKSDANSTRAYRNFLAQETAREREEFHSMKEEFQSMKKEVAVRQQLRDDRVMNSGKMASKREAETTSGKEPAGPDPYDQAYDDVSLSNETSHVLMQIADDHIRHNLTLKVKWGKHHYKQLNSIRPSYGYFSVRCGFDEMEREAFTILPSFRKKKHLFEFNSGIEEEFEIPSDVKTSIQRFKVTEEKYHIENVHHASSKIPFYFYSMCAFLKRSTLYRYQCMLTHEQEKNAHNLRTELFLHRNIKDILSIPYDLKVKIITELASSYARNRHASELFHHLLLAFIHDVTQMMESSLGRKVHLAEVLLSMGFLQAWNFSETDLDYANVIRRALNHIAHNPLLEAVPFEIPLGQNKTFKGILPSIKAKVCPSVF